MIARLLNLCGLYLGAKADLIGATPDNPDGYWENLKFQEINQELLNRFGGAWDYPPPFSEGWVSGENLLGCKIKAEDLRQEFEGHGAWGWKDPRSSLTLPFWLSVFAESKMVVCLRHPLEVILSLHRRKPPEYAIGLTPWRILTLFESLFSPLQRSAPSEPLSFRAWKIYNNLEAAVASRTRQTPLRGFGAAWMKGYDRVDLLLKIRRRKPLSYRIGLQLWTTYNQRILDSTSPRNRIITHYDAYYPNPQKELRRALNFLDMQASDEEIERSCRASVSDYRHHRLTGAQLAEVKLPAEVNDLYRRMCAEAEVSDA